MTPILLPIYEINDKKYIIASNVTVDITLFGKFFYYNYLFENDTMPKNVADKEKIFNNLINTILNDLRINHYLLEITNEYKTILEQQLRTYGDIFKYPDIYNGNRTIELNYVGDRYRIAIDKINESLRTFVNKVRIDITDDNIVPEVQRDPSVTKTFISPFIPIIERDQLESFMAEKLDRNSYVDFNGIMFHLYGIKVFTYHDRESEQDKVMPYSNPNILRLHISATDICRLLTIVAMKKVTYENNLSVELIDIYSKTINEYIYSNFLVLGGLDNNKMLAVIGNVVELDKYCKFMSFLMAKDEYIEIGISNYLAYRALYPRIDLFINEPFLHKSIDDTEMSYQGSIIKYYFLNKALYDESKIIYGLGTKMSSGTSRIVKLLSQKNIYRDFFSDIGPQTSTITLPRPDNISDRVFYVKFIFDKIKEYCEMNPTKKYMVKDATGTRGMGIFSGYCKYRNNKVINRIILREISSVINDIINTVRPGLTVEQKEGDMRNILGGRAILIQDFIDSIQCGHHPQLKTLKFRILLLVDIFKNEMNNVETQISTLDVLSATKMKYEILNPFDTSKQYISNYAEMDPNNITSTNDPYINECLRGNDVDLRGKIDIFVKDFTKGLYRLVNQEVVKTKLPNNKRIIFPLLCDVMIDKNDKNIKVFDINTGGALYMDNTYSKFIVDYIANKNLLVNKMSSYIITDNVDNPLRFSMITEQYVHNLDDIQLPDFDPNDHHTERSADTKRRYNIWQIDFNDTNMYGGKHNYKLVKI